MAKILINRDFARLWLGQAVSTVGDYVFDTTLVVWVATVLFRGNGRLGPLAVSGLVLCTILATLLIGPVAGVFVDRWNHRRIMLASEVIRLVLVGGLTLVTLLPVSALPAGLWLALLYVVVFAVNAMEQFFNPARFATIGDIVTGEVDQTRAFGLGTATASSAAIIGPPLAAPLLFAAGIKWALLLNALSYLISFAAIRSVRFPATAGRAAAPAGEAAARSSWRTEFTDGLRMFWHNRFLMSIAVIAIFAQLGTGPINTLDVYFLRENLHTSQNLLGFLSTAAGAGGIAGALLAGWVVSKLTARTTTWLGLMAGGLAVLLLARQTTFAAALVAIFLVLMPITLINTALMPQLLAVTPKEYLGRMNAVLLPVIQLSSTVSVIISGALVSTVLLHFHADAGGLHIGRIDTLYTAGGLIIVAAAIFAIYRLPPREAVQPAAGSETSAAAGEPAEPAGPAGLESPA